MQRTSLQCNDHGWHRQRQHTVGRFDHDEDTGTDTGTDPLGDTARTKIRCAITRRKQRQPGQQGDDGNLLALAEIRREQEQHDKHRRRNYPDILLQRLFVPPRENARRTADGSNRERGQADTHPNLRCKPGQPFHDEKGQIEPG